MGKIRWGGEKTKSSPSQPEKEEVKMPTDFDLNEIMKKSLDDLTPEELKARLINIEAKISNVNLDASVHGIGKTVDELGPDDLVLITVPASPMGDIYNLNFKYFPPGQHKVSKRVAQHLAYIISESWKIERERLVSRTNKFTGAILRGEQLASIERFEDIMKN